ncbi:hypothetical protein HBH64_132610 [Parastagonospora nodorum]|nr:hypothetical protein HBH53_003360 [Parastagonospora nodorum]KAH3982230.1 hypothetical protein HBH52_076250 [Parastagonospora nodorum]KAH4477261.1 hypothetical protein HBH90_006740 [Parastagonospora nodorum]KAH4505912.1 hypothetical protein HBH88_050500 [Parastagonospora nodorum]KAH4607454.1 hypothetical protein HBH82_089700 [Parastagonospora nodorum]
MSTVVIADNVRDCPRGIGYHRRAGNGAKEPHHQDLRQIVAQRTWYDENRKGCHRNEVNWSSSVHFG